MAESAEYTPTLEDMRAVWVSHRAFNNYERSFGKFWEVKADSEFDRWLETVRAEAKAEALNEVLTVLQAEVEDAPPANHEEDNYEAGYIAGLDFLLNAKALANQYKEQS